LVNVVVQTTFCFWSFHLQFHLFNEALARVAGPFDFLTTPFMRAQNELCLEPDFWGAFNLLPVALFNFARPLAVNPAPFDAGSFSPLPSDKLVDLDKRYSLF
jgi:hypothetical protein